MFSHPDYDGHEALLFAQDTASGLRALVAIHDTTLGPFPIANLFCRGHRLRLDISSSNFPHFDVNPNSGEPDGEWRQPRIARNRVFVEAARPSHVLLPIIPPSERHSD